MDDLSRYWKTVVDTMQDGLLVVDPQGTIVSMNQTAERLTGYRKRELLGKSCRVLACNGCKVFTGNRAKHWCSLFSYGKNRVKRCLIMNKSGEAIHVMKQASLLRDESGEVIGAVETLTDISDVVRQENEISSLRRTLRRQDTYHGLLGKSAPMERLFALIENAAQSDAPVAIFGESGVGKELVAKAIHHSSPRRKKPFVKVSCAALNENLLESELFGHVKGAFTGAHRARVGRFEAAHGGALFLDEIGDIPLSTQVKLLRVLEEKEIERVGDHKPVKVDVHIITATNKDLEGLVGKGTFREDLFYRINVIPIYIPTLRERTEDIPVLAQSFCERISLSGSKSITTISPEAMEILQSYAWPGNVRELRNTIEYAFVLCRGDEIKPEHLPPKVTSGDTAYRHTGPLDRSDRNASEKERLIEALRQAKGRQAKAAELLGVSRVTVWKRMKKYGVTATYR
ncbi:MAG: sigma-54-dependent Fis family transcriptional regulator [Desulfobacterales bacterium S7086C20]|nr:MAG: sigma-54-dependent Fis family transcriptional regulator [Desulfobacterales bacterium S7086C20]